MEIPGLKLISSYWRRRSRGKASSHHLMLAGIYQGVFLNQWGHAEIEIDLSPLKDYWRRDPTINGIDTFIQQLHTVWIYKKRNKVLFFTKKRLVSHFTWRGFEEKRRLLEEANAPTTMQFATSVSSRMARVA
jgi:hypothetical protein